MAHQHTRCAGHSCSCCTSKTCHLLNRRDFMGIAGMGLAAAAIGSSAMSSMAAAMGNTDYLPLAPRKLVIQPVLTAALSQRREKTSWRNWGGFHTQQDITDEQQRIQKELDGLAGKAEFGLEIRPLITLNDKNKAAEVAKQDHDVTLIYAATSWVDVLETLTNPAKWTMMFLRHKSGPVYLWYEVAHNRYLRKTVDQFGQPGVDYQDVVVDSTDELLWRMRAVYGLKNTLGKKVVCIGGAAGWGEGGQKAPDIAKTTWKMDLQSVDYPALQVMIDKARQNSELVRRCNDEAAKLLKQNGVSIDTNPEFLGKSFLLTQVFRELMQQAGTDAITVNNCMGTIMGASETTACMPLSLLNDTGFSAYCESDFVAIPSGLLLHYISSKPTFLNDPTYPHDGMVTLAHCTGPRKMDGQNLEPVKILTHFESDYGAAPKVEMKLGQNITVIDPDFDNKQHLGFEGEIIDNPFLDICRTQIDVQIKGSVDTLNEQTRGFHWNVCYGNYLKEYGYALRKIGVNWMNLTV